ncbi:tetratricopeptide repeat protein [Paludisphaera soli]|uniref:tetratricopeptide repeat protein n=1 Tax=Paludisphaera soli TaxID=2712865 RepID=UPI0013EC8ACE|nr:tetratricopeptide repeat protein [Paludisphaera soli]
MPRPSRGFVGPIIACLGVALLGEIDLRAGEDPRKAEAFLLQLRERGYFDLASDYIERLRSDPGIGEPLKGQLDYHEGRALIDEASRTTDLARRRELLDRAAGRLEAFIKDRPEDATTLEALVEIARSLFERGHLARLVGEDSQDAERKAAKLDESRATYQQAADAYARAAERLEASYKTKAGYLPNGDPRIEERNRVRNAMLDASLKQGIALYELAQSHPPDSKERAEILDQAIARFDALYKSNRTELAGIAAQMFQAKCFEEQGKIGEAIGIYHQVLDQPNPALRDLKRNVHYFYIVALTKRKQFPLAADEAVKWLQTYDRRDERRSMEGVGVYYELARSLDAQITPETPKAERDPAAKKIVEALSQVVRTPTRYKTDALALLKKYKPNVAVEAREIARLSFDEALNQGEEALASREWDRAIALLRAAGAKADPRRNGERIDLARYNLAYACYMNKQLPEAEVLAGHLARRRPRWEFAPASSSLAMQAILDQYNTPPHVDRAGDLDRYVELAEYTAATWPDREEADDARIMLGQIHQGRGEYDRAIADFDGVRERSPRRLEARTRLGGAHWAKSRSLARGGDEKKAEADAEAAQAVAILRQALDDRKAAGVPEGDAGYLGNAADLGSALTESGKVDEALAALRPIVEAQGSKSGPAYGRLMESYLLAQINAGQVEPAIASMRAVEESGDGANRAQLYYKLGRLLEGELDELRKANQPQKLAKMKESFRTFLMALAQSKNGQTFESLRWAAEGLLSLDAGAEAEGVLRGLIDESEADADFKKQQGATERLLRAKVKLANALRIQKKFDQAASVVDELLADATYKRYLDPLVEKGELLDAQAEAGQGSWNAAGAHWQDVAQKLGRSRPRPESYFDAWYRAAVAYAKQKQTAKARQTLTAIIRLNPGVGGPAMKQKYEDLLATLK